MCFRKSQLIVVHAQDEGCHSDIFANYAVRNDCKNLLLEWWLWKIEVTF